MKIKRGVIALFLVLGVVMGLSACGEKDPTDLSDKEFEAIIENAVEALNQDFEETLKKEYNVKNYLVEGRVFWDDVREKYFVRLDGGSSPWYLQQVEGDEYKVVYEKAEEIEKLTVIFIKEFEDENHEN